MIHDIVIGAGAMVLTGAVLQSGTVVSKVSGNQEVVRKILHSLCGVIVVITLLLISSQPVFLTVVALTGISLIITVHTQAFPVILYGDKKRDYGLVCFAVGLFIAALLWWGHKPAIVAGALTLGFADSAAAVVGQRFGRHRILASGATRSAEGTVTFAAVCFAVVAADLIAYHATRPQATAGICAVVAVTAAAIEAIVPSAIDNLLIIPWVSAVIVLGETRPAASPDTWLAAALFAVVLVPAVVLLGWLDLPGALAACLVTAATVALAGWSWLAPAAAFFALSSLLSIRRGPSRESSRMRGLRQVTVNGIILVLLPVLGNALDPHYWWYYLSIGGIAAATGDTWAGEIGRHTRRSPVSLRDFTRVPAGTSGAVTWLGTAGSVLGGLTIGLVAALTSHYHLIGVAIAAGFLGSLADSLTGAFWQATFECPGCGAVVESRLHCGDPAILRRGARWFDNEVVNAVANGTGMAVAGIALLIV